MDHVNDNDHLRQGGVGFREGLEAALADAENATLFIEGVNATEESKRQQERFYNAFLDGEAELTSVAEVAERSDGDLDAPVNVDFDEADEADAAAEAEPEDEEEKSPEDLTGYALVHEDEWYFVNQPDASHATLLQVLALHRDKVDRIDTGPVHEDLSEEMLATIRQIAYSPGGMDAQDQDLMMTTVRARDASWEAYIRDQVAEGAVDPDDAITTMGGAHRLDERLARTFDVTVHNPPPTFSEYEDSSAEVRRQAIRDELDDADAGYALLGDPADVVADLGVEGARVRLAELGAALLADDRFEAAAPGWAERFDRLFDVDDDRSDVEHVERLQEAATGMLDDQIDLDAAVEFDDLDPSPPAERPSPPAERVTTSMLDDPEDDVVVRTAVAAVLEERPTTPRTLAAIARVFEERDRSADPGEVAPMHAVDEDPRPSRWREALEVYADREETEDSNPLAAMFGAGRGDADARDRIDSVLDGIEAKLEARVEGDADREGTPATSAAALAGAIGDGSDDLTAAIRRITGSDDVYADHKVVIEALADATDLDEQVDPDEPSATPPSTDAASSTQPALGRGGVASVPPGPDAIVEGCARVADGVVDRVASTLDRDEPASESNGGRGGVD